MHFRYFHVATRTTYFEFTSVLCEVEDILLS